MPRLALLAIALLAGLPAAAVAETTTTSSKTSREPLVTTLATTRTVTQQQVTSVTASKSVKIEIQGGTTRTSTSGDSSGDSGFPAWGWVLIGAGAVALLAAAFALGRRGKHEPPPPGAPPPDVPT
jgi:hypothetical protein